MLSGEEGARRRTPGPTCTLCLGPQKQTLGTGVRALFMKSTHSTDLRLPGHTHAEARLRLFIFYFYNRLKLWKPFLEGRARTGCGLPPWSGTPRPLLHPSATASAPKRTWHPPQWPRLCCRGLEGSSPPAVRPALPSDWSGCVQTHLRCPAQPCSCVLGANEASAPPSEVVCTLGLTPPPANGDTQERTWRAWRRQQPRVGV